MSGFSTALTMAILDTMEEKLVLYVGPMKSGKTGRLLSDVSPLEHSSVRYSIFQPASNVRDGAQIKSRNGSVLSSATAVHQVHTFPTSAELMDTDVIAIEEFHLFGEELTTTVKELLIAGKVVRAAGLDMNYRGRLTARYLDLLALAPHKVIYCKAACEVCKSLNAKFTQVRKNGVPVLDGLPEVLPEDGTYQYIPVCRSCFKQS